MSRKSSIINSTKAKDVVKYLHPGIYLLEKVVDIVDERINKTTKRDMDSLGDFVEKGNRNNVDHMTGKTKRTSGLHVELDERGRIKSISLGTKDEIEGEVKYK